MTFQRDKHMGRNLDPSSGCPHSDAHQTQGWDTVRQKPTALTLRLWWSRNRNHRPGPGTRSPWLGSWSACCCTFRRRPSRTSCSDASSREGGGVSFASWKSGKRGQGEYASYTPNAHCTINWHSRHSTGKGLKNINYFACGTTAVSVVP